MPTLNTPDGLSLQWRTWPAPAAAARGSVLIVHGLGEHIGRYEALAARLREAGWLVAGYDHRGHGASGGARGRLAADDSLLTDLALVIDQLRPQLPAPLVLLGHSMGGLIASRFVAEALQPAPAAWSRPVDALVLSSPALDPGLNAFQRLLLATMSRLAPDVAVGNGLDPADICRDPAVVAAYVADPLVHDRVTARLVRFLVDGGEHVRGVAGQWRTPTRLLYGGADRCVAPAGSDAFAAAAPRAVVQATRYDRLVHEIFNEPEREQPIADLLAWLSTLGRAPA